MRSADPPPWLAAKSDQRKNQDLLDFEQNSAKFWFFGGDFRENLGDLGLKPFRNRYFQV
tara:strand:+ start:23 stop:199 length:177 start_codon:yes stop_codon:yes gene_type:complete